MDRFIHVYENNMWGFLTSKENESDILVTENEYQEIIKNQKNGLEYILINKNGKTIEEMFKLKPIEKNVIKDVTLEERISALENLVMGVI